MNSLNSKSKEGSSKSIFNILKQGTTFKDKNVFHQIKDKKIIDNKAENQTQPNKPLLKNNEEYNTDDSLSDNENAEEGYLHTTYSEINKDDNNIQIKHFNKRRERILQLLHSHHIKLEGEDIPYPASNFTKMKKRYSINKRLFTNMKKLGFQKPTPVQMTCIPIMMKKRNVISIAPTGSGKTLAYLIPLMSLLEKHDATTEGPRGIIFAPTIELADQIYKDFLFFEMGIKDHLQVKMIHKLNMVPTAFKEQIKNVDILITTPLKFIKLAKKTNLDLSMIQHIVLDEADKYFELGFEDQIKQIFELFKNNSPHYSMFSATVHPGIYIHNIINLMPIPKPVVEDFLKNFLKEPIKVIIGGRNSVINTVDQSLRYVGNEYGKLIEIKNMIANGQWSPPVLIFVQSKERAIELYDELKNQNIKHECIHSDKTKQEREDIVMRFRLGKIWTLITTDLMARGIDFKGVNLVINYDFPTSTISYIHRVGRTGRANRAGKAITLFTDNDKAMLRSIANVLKISVKFNSLDMIMIANLFLIRDALYQIGC